MAKKLQEQKHTSTAAAPKKLLRKLELAKVEQKDAASKVGKLRSRLQAAEALQEKRALRVEKLRVRTKPQQSAGGAAETAEGGTHAAHGKQSVISDAHVDPLSVEVAANGNHNARGVHKRTRGK